MINSTLLSVSSLPKGVLLAGCLSLAVPMFVGCELLLKQAADTGKAGYFFAGVTLCTVANILYLPIIKDGLALGFILTTLGMSAAVIACSVWHFHETLTAPQWISCALILIASILLALPGDPPS